MQAHVEFLSSQGFGQKDGDWRFVAMAIDGQLVPTFYVHESDWRRYSDDESKLRQFLTTQGLGLLDEYGDARSSN